MPKWRDIFDGGTLEIEYRSSSSPVPPLIKMNTKPEDETAKARTTEDLSIFVGGAEGCGDISNTLVRDNADEACLG